MPVRCCPRPSCRSCPMRRRSPSPISRIFCSRRRDAASASDARCRARLSMAPSRLRNSPSTTNSPSCARSGTWKSDKRSGKPITNKSLASAARTVASTPGPSPPYAAETMMAANSSRNGERSGTTLVSANRSSTATATTSTATPYRASREGGVLSRGADMGVEAFIVLIRAGRSNGGAPRGRAGARGRGVVCPAGASPIEFPFRFTLPGRKAEHGRMQIRNFSIIAHIDHGKSTLSDRLLMRAGAITEREFKEQILDDMDLERERGITIKASAVTVFHKHGDEEFMLNFIDTPGHVDFHYEVQKALQACEGAILVVDATQGVQAQTVANAYAAIDVGLEIIPVINKIDLPSADPIRVAEEIEQVLGFSAEDAILVSAKTGQGIDELISKLCDQLPPPRGKPDLPARALIFDSIYDDYRGVIVYVRVVDGELKKRQKVRLMGAGREYEISDLGKLMPRPKQVDRIGTGEVGYFVASIKDLHDVRIGDTVTDALAPAPEALPGYKPIQQMVFCDFYPGGKTQYEELRDAMDRLQLNDSSFTFAPENSDALGFGFRCGFLGLLHMEIIQERLEREFNIEVVQTAPTVTYEILMTDKSVKRIDAPSELPNLTHVEEIREPYILMNLIVPRESVGGIIQLCEDRRGIYKKQEYIGSARVILTYEIPLAEVIYDFYDKLKSVTKGYGTMDYDLIGFRVGELVKMDILVNGDRVDALSVIVHKTKAEGRGRKLLVRLKEEIDKHLFEIPLQAAIGGKIIARETIKSVGKNVTAKCYGGDVTRKRKLLEKQKEGKKRMKRVGSVDIPQEAFMAILESED